MACGQIFADFIRLDDPSISDPESHPFTLSENGDKSKPILLSENPIDCINKFKELEIKRGVISCFQGGIESGHRIIIEAP